MSGKTIDKRKIEMSLFGDPNAPKEHELQYDWSEGKRLIGVQGGNKGVVFSKNGGYTTAFFEAFPNKPSCFIRGEGSDIAAAETDAWEKYQKILICEHEMERRDRTDGYGYCKHCTYSSTVFEPLTKCCKCGVPTAYSRDFRKKSYCKKHRRVMPKDPNPHRWAIDMDKRLPRKVKKKYKEAFMFDLYYRNKVNAKKIRFKNGTFKLSGAGYRIIQFSFGRVKKYTKAVLATKRMYLKYLKRKAHVSKSL